MGVTITVNDRTVIHRGSEGMALGMPDICKTPKSGEPVPYVNLAISADLEEPAASVFADGFAVAKRTSFIGRSYGDEPGVDGGVISGCNRGKASWITYSCDVFIEGEPVPRALDLTIQNHGSPSNTPPSFWSQLLAMKNGMPIVCGVVCVCHALRQKMNCFKATMASSSWAPPFWGGPSTRVYDPFFQGMYIEASFGPVGPKGKPTGKWEVIPSTAKSSRWFDKDGKPLPLPAGEHVPGSRRPDVVIAKDPQKPLTGDNVKDIIEVKFPGDKLRDEQKKRYNELLPPGRTMRLASPDECKCPHVDQLRSPKRYQRPIPEEELQPFPPQPEVEPVVPPQIEPVPARKTSPDLEDWLVPLIPGLFPILSPRPSPSPSMPTWLPPIPIDDQGRWVTWDEETQQWVPVLDRLEGPTA